MKSDSEVKCQQAAVRLSSYQELETSLRCSKNPGREVMVKVLPLPLLALLLRMQNLGPVTSLSCGPKLSGDEGVGSITLHVQVAVLGCIQVWSRKLC